MYTLGIKLMQSQSQSFYSYLTQGVRYCYLNNLSETTFTENFIISFQF